MRSLSKLMYINEFLVPPIVRDAFNAVNGTIICYRQGPSIFESDEQEKGTLPRVVEGLVAFVSSNDSSKYMIKLSMISLLDPVEALQRLSCGIVNRAIGGDPYPSALNELIYKFAQDRIWKVSSCGSGGVGESRENWGRRKSS
ncbi:hypothetical protein PTKIN_Ptkin19aG0024000 [Pterospermum kingtungense]